MDYIFHNALWSVILFVEVTYAFDQKREGALAMEERWKLTEEEKEHLIKKCPKCGSENLDPMDGWNSACGWVKCYDCGHGPFWWLKVNGAVVDGS